MKLVLNVTDQDERAADLIALGSLLAALMKPDNQPIIERWQGFLLKIYDELAENNGANVFDLSFRPAVRDTFRGKSGATQ